MKALAGCLLYWVMILCGIVAVAFVVSAVHTGSLLRMTIGLIAAIATAGAYWLIDRAGLID